VDTVNTPLSFYLEGLSVLVQQLQTYTLYNYKSECTCVHIRSLAYRGNCEKKIPKAPSASKRWDLLPRSNFNCWISRSRTAQHFRLRLTVRPHLISTFCQWLCARMSLSLPL